MGKPMYAIRNKRTKKWLFGTDRRYHPWHQRTAEDRALILPDFDTAKLEFLARQCNKDYEIVPVRLEEIE
jgi:hypothetical protein